MIVWISIKSIEIKIFQCICIDVYYCRCVKTLIMKMNVLKPVHQWNIMILQPYNLLITQMENMHTDLTVLKSAQVKLILFFQIHVDEKGSLN